MTTLSVTEVRNALRCPRIFALGRRGGRSVAFPVASSALGATFHRIAARAAELAATPPAGIVRLGEHATTEQVRDALESWLLSLLVAELDADPLYQSMPSEVDELAEALRELAKYLAARLERHGGRARDALPQVMRRAEVELERVWQLPDGVSVRMTGRADALYGDEQGRVDVIEYKLTDDGTDELDRAQVVLYREALRDMLGVVAEPVILRFEPALRVTRIPPAEADALVGERLVPMITAMAKWESLPETAPATPHAELCPVCPLRRECAEFYQDRLERRDEPPATATRPRPDPDGRLALTSEPPINSEQARDEAGYREAEQLRTLFEAVVRRRGVSAQVKNPIKIGPRLITLDISVVRGRVGDVDRASDDIQHRFHAEHSVHCNYEKAGGRRAFQFVRSSPRNVSLRQVLAQRRDWLSERSGRFVLGEGMDGALVVGDLADPACCHLLVGGMTGSGKSVLLRGIIASLTQYSPPSELQLTLVDPKRVSFGPVRVELAAHLARPVLFEAEETVTVLDELCTEMDRRYDLFADDSVQDLGEYNATRAPASRLARHVVVVDEFADLVSVKQTKEDFLEAVQRLGAKARAAGIHLILATQRPDAKTVPGLLKANLVGKIALRVQSAVNSKIVIDQSGAERLLGKGDLLADLGDGIVRAQAPAPVLRATPVT